TSVASEISVPPHQLPLEPESSFLDHPAQITADAAYVLEQLTVQTGLDVSAVRFETLTAYLLGIATAFLGEARLTWCQGAISTSAELTRQQCAGRTVVAIAASDVVAEAVVTARQLGTPMQRWTLGSATDTSDLTPAGILQCRQLDLEPLLATCPAARPETASTPPGSSTAAEGAVSQTGAETSPTRPSAVMDGWDTLWQLDVALYYRRIDGVTGQGNTHTLKRQALLLGRTYAERWSSVVTDATREQLDAVKDQRWVPGRLYADLLNFADTHGLGVHGSQVIKDLLRRGFWQHTAGTDHDHQQSAAA
ncbi:MAG TPA: hypothetical protein VJY85_00795, partial [Candidatus Limnocylindria bacterium]|nr:hypothetical protein [Candidatus Limnocylindria bacterium]